MGNGQNHDNPEHTVVVDSFLIARSEVTIEQWQEYLSETGVAFRWDNYYWGPMAERTSSAQAPVLYVTWWHAVDYCNWLSRRGGLVEAYTFQRRPENWGELAYQANDWVIEWNRDATGFRLPTEAEWEYAARGGSSSKGFLYSGSDHPLESGWWKSNSDGVAQDVASKLSNELGIHDMSGNGDEWCWDIYMPDYYRHSPLQNPAGPSQGQVEHAMSDGLSLERVNRGEDAFGSPETIFDRSSFLPHGTEFVTVRPVRNAE